MHLATIHSVQTDRDRCKPVAEACTK